MQDITGINFSIWAIIKILTLVVLCLYIFFAFVITRQVKIMTSTLTLGSEFFAKFLAFVHLLFAVLIFVTALVIL